VFIASDGLPVCQVPGANSVRAVRDVVLAGYRGDEATARAALGHDVPAVRAAGWSALARMGALGPNELAGAFGDPAVEVRRRACELAGRVEQGQLVANLAAELLRALSDSSPAVVEAASHALGQLTESLASPSTEHLGRAAGLLATVAEALALTARSHPDALCREAAVAALGAFGASGAGRDVAVAAIAAALSDKPAVRRRAVVALSNFDGRDAWEAVQEASGDRDWQVRELAAELLRARQEPLSS